MGSLAKVLILQECYFGAFLAVLGFFIGIQHGWMAGVEVFIYTFLLIQLIVLWINRNLIKAALAKRNRSKKSD